MKGGIMTFSGSLIMILIGVGIIWWFRSVSVSEAFITSERHKESFSTLNYAEFAKKTLEEAAYMYSYIGAAKMGITGGTNVAQKKDEIAIWKTAPDEITIKNELKKNISGEIDNSLPETSIPGKFLVTSYLTTKIDVAADKSDLSASDKFSVKGEKNIVVKKNLESSGIYVTAKLKGIIDTEIKLKYFALYDAARQFISSGQAEARINNAFAAINTIGSATRSSSKCGTFDPCNYGNPYDSSCPSSAAATEPADAEALANTGYATLAGTTFSETISGSPFSSFLAKFEKYGTLTPKAGYNDLDKSVSTGSCSFTCSYLKYNACQTTREVCVPVDPPTDPPSPDVCTDVCVGGDDTLYSSCSAGTKTSTITFTFVADMYAKYSSEDPNSQVPSQNLKSIAGKTLPYDTLKFNFLTHSCSVIKGGSVSTELKSDVTDCSITTSHVI
ncbi:MAG: hypothetical protein V1836_03695 [Candidatus Aenigmatarchaeota archaeon]